MEAQRSKDTPAARVDWNLACIEARRNGQPLPTPPWEMSEQPQSSTSESNPIPALRSARLPKAPEEAKRRRIASESIPRTEAGPRKPRVLTAPRDTSDKASPSPLLEKPPHVREPAISVRQQPDVAIAMAREKEILIDSILLRCGIPPETLKFDNRTQAVMDNYKLLVKSGGHLRHSALLHKYNIGRQFVLNGNMTVVMDMAEAVVHLLAATSRIDLTSETAAAERMAERNICSLNIHFLRQRLTHKAVKRAS